MSGAFLPSNSDKKALQESNAWVYILGMPLILYAIMAISFFTVLIYDSPKYNIIKGDTQNTLNGISRIYHSDDQEEEIKFFIQSTM